MGFWLTFVHAGLGGGCFLRVCLAFWGVLGGGGGGDGDLGADLDGGFAVGGGWAGGDVERVVC